ncbi:MAG: Nramp family divalent metal transporter [Pyrinomonadaceae bacterium]|nr:Nramp family divalent metal transporter [Pyrinomonadaceae bacterium]MBP6213576.1 Nramp family divalent metal transporter [Pyrinomonadaceae bacterium]
MDRKDNPIKRLLDRLGPGLITGASDDDPSGIGTYSQAGAALGFATLWTAIVTLPLMVVVQHICAKIGMVSGRGLAGVLQRYYSRKLLYPVVIGLVVANTINAGADISAIAAAINMFVPIPISVMVVPIAVAIVVLQVWGSYRLIVKVFKWLTMSLFAYVIAAFLAKPDWYEVARATFLPQITLSSEYITTIVAILGTTISPYLFFWEASEEVEEEKSEGRTHLAERKGATDAEIKKEKIDTIVGMLFCNVVFYFVILAAGATLHVSGKTDIQSATDAAQALRPLAGDLATVLFAIGLIGAGLLAVPVLTGSAAYAVAETFGWPSGLDEKPRHAKKFYAVIAASTLIGVAIDFLGINPIKALFWTAVINGVVAPPLLVVVMLVANNKRVMGARTNGMFTNIVGWLAAAVMFGAAIAMFVTWGN